MKPEDEARLKDFEKKWKPYLAIKSNAEIVWLIEKLREQDKHNQKLRESLEKLSHDSEPAKYRSEMFEIARVALARTIFNRPWGQREGEI